MVGSDTIFALSSGGLPSGVAVIRVSGPAASSVVVGMAGDLPPARQAALRSIRTRNGSVLDQGLVVFFPAPASFTGEDTAEFHVHGGRATVKAVLAEMALIPGMRAADAGEFSRRAFHNGKLDLVEIEGLADIVAAQTEMQRRLALEHAAGGVSRLYDDWTRRLTFARAMIEAELDFADEEDVPGAIAQSIRDDLAAMVNALSDHLAGARIGEIIRDGLSVVITGPPNVGKSSLLNHLANRDVAIVTDVPGTTRDIIAVDLDLDGYAVRISDTAGIRDTDEIVELEGIRRAKTALENADLVLRLIERPDVISEDDRDNGTPVILVSSKLDIEDTRHPDPRVISLSTRTGEGTDILLEHIRRALPHISDSTAIAVPSRERHNEALRTALHLIQKALNTGTDDLEIQAEHLRLASDAIGRITGRVDVEGLLDVIFSQFCIGK